MPEVWGLLPKSQIDDELIEAAIARLILEHNNDETAHLGVGQSLQSHKASAIIDHVVASIVADKITSKQFWCRTSFDGFDGWNQEGGTFTLAWPGVLIWTGSLVNDYSLVASNAAGFNDYCHYGKNPLFQYIFSINIGTSVEFYAYLGDGPFGDVTEKALGFRYVGGVLQAYYYNGANFITQNIAGITFTSEHIWRVELKTAEAKAYFYIDGVEKAVLSDIDVSYTSSNGPGFHIKTLTTQARVIRLIEVFYSRDY